MTHNKLFGLRLTAINEVHSHIWVNVAVTSHLNYYDFSLNITLPLGYTLKYTTPIRYTDIHWRPPGDGQMP